MQSGLTWLPIRLNAMYALDDFVDYSVDRGITDRGLAFITMTTVKGRIGVVCGSRYACELRRQL